MILHRYLARRFLAWFFGVSGALGTVSVLLDSINLIAGLPHASFAQILRASLLGAPATLYAILPLIMLLAAAGLFVALSRSSELTVARGAGLSALRALTGPVLAALALAALALTLGNPLVASTTRAYDQFIAGLNGQTTQAFRNGASGLWLRQSDASGQTVIHGLNANSKGTHLLRASFTSFTPDGTPLARIDADEARLEPGGWRLSAAKIWPLDAPNPEAAAQQVAGMDLPSPLTEAGIEDSFGEPRGVPIWELPDLIDQLNTAGFSALRYRVWFASELARPLFLVAMMLVGAGFTLRHHRAGGMGLMVLSAIVSGFGLYFLRRLAMILGENGQLPVLLAAAGPALAALLLALTLLLYKEDG